MRSNPRLLNLLKKILCLGLSFYLILFTLTPLVSAQSIEELDQKLREKQNEISKLENQLNGLKEQEKTLNSQIKYIDGQTKLTELKIEETNFQITKLEKEITELSTRIERISTSVDTLSEVLLNRIVTSYKYSNYSGLDLLLSSHGFSDMLERIKYLQVVQAYDKKQLYQLQATKTLYKDQKDDKETRQAQQEKLKQDLTKYQQDLEKQKTAKEELLKVTQNDEAKYQALISKLRADLASITAAISNIGAKIGPVGKGDIIAAVGSTGCSTGPHLHFEVYENAKVEGGRIVGSRVDPQPFLDNGRLAKPLDNYLLTAKYGAVGNDYIPGWPPHTGIDMAINLGTPIKASEKGIAYSTSGPCKNPPAGGSSTGKGVIIDHENGLVTLYWHIL